MLALPSPGWAGWPRGAARAGGGRRSKARALAAWSLAAFFDLRLYLEPLVPLLLVRAFRGGLLLGLAVASMPWRTRAHCSHPVAMPCPASGPALSGWGAENSGSSIKLVQAPETPEEPSFASLSATSLPGTSAWPGTHIRNTARVVDKAVMFSQILLLTSAAHSGCALPITTRIANLLSEKM